MLLNWVSHAETDWPETSPEIKKGLVLSGDKLVDNQDFRDRLLEMEPDAIGGEMEGAGVYVASQSAKIEWLLIKAVCDWADGNKATNKNELQTQAAKAAADFTVQVLRTNSESFP
jgi:nucleoside phosphorylase